MSWLPIEAVILICKTCDWSLRVDIDNKGSIQIGDDNVAFLLRMYKDKDKIPMDTPVPEGFFKSYHTMPVGCTCQDCYIHREGAIEQAKIDAAVQQINDYFDQIIESHQIFKNRHDEVINLIMERWLEDIDLEWARQINEKVYLRTLGHAQFERPDQRTRLIKQFVAEGKSSIIQSVRDYFGEHNELQELQDEYSHIVEPLFQQINSFTESVRRTQRDPIIRAYEHYDNTKPINLNNYIRYESTLAFPSDDCPEYHVYMPIQYNLNQGHEWLEDHRTIGDLMHGEKAIINEVRKKIMTMVNG